MRRHVIVAYDIADPVRLRRVHRIVRDFGDPLQYSVFACQLGEKDRAVLEARLLEAMNAQVDQVLFADLGPVRREHDDPPRCDTLGRPLGSPPARVLVV
jgi:CRISPR-associated protein Cas2